MTTPAERYRALVWAREFMEELRCSEGVSPEIRRQAVVILRHFPRNSDLDYPGVLVTDWITAPPASRKD
jgi:hypothetical protein